MYIAACDNNNKWVAILLMWLHIFNDCVSTRQWAVKSKEGLPRMTHRWLTGWGYATSRTIHTHTHTGSQNPHKELIDEQDNPFRSYLLTWNAISLRANQSPIASDEFLCLKNAQSLQRFMVIVKKAQKWHFNHFISAIFKLSCSSVALDGAASPLEGVLIESQSLGSELRRTTIWMDNRYLRMYLSTKAEQFESHSSIIRISFFTSRLQVHDQVGQIFCIFRADFTQFLHSKPCQNNPITEISEPSVILRRKIQS